MKKNLIIITSIVVIVAILIYFFYPKKKEETKIQNYTVTRGDIVKIVESNGKIIPNADVEIKCKASGQITNLPYDISDYVKKGDLLLKLDPIDENRNIKQAEISLMQSQIALSKAESDYLLSKINYDNNIKQADINISNSKIKRDDSKIKEERSKKVNEISPQIEQLEGQLKTSKAKLDEIDYKYKNAKILYEKDKSISTNDLENLKTQYIQALNDYKSSEAKLKEQKLINNNDYDNAVNLAKQTELDYQNSILNKKGIENNKIQVELKKKDMDIAKTRLEADRISLEVSKQRLKDTQIFSPINGYITARDVQVGQIIASAINNVGGGTTVITVSDLSKVFVMASVDESDISSVYLNQKVEVLVDAYRNKKFEGKIVQIYTKGQNVSNVVTFSVKIEIVSKNKDLLKPEMTATARIILGEKRNTLLVNSDYVKRDKNKFKVTIKKSEEDKEDKEVELGLFDGDNYEVLSGLNENDILLPQEKNTNSRWNRRNNMPPIRF